jgi:DNA-binding CsgD family transcriptional regulator
MTMVDIDESIAYKVMQIARAQDGRSVRYATGRMIRSLIRCDDLLWIDLDVQRPSATVLAGARLRPDRPMAEALGSHGASHPALRSYLTAPHDLSPRRVSDVASSRTWLKSSAYRLVFRPRGARFQLGLVTEIHSTVARGWMLIRECLDFTADDLATAGRLLPTLIPLATLAKIEKPAQEGPTHDLTPRELEVLNLVARGFTAQTISRQLGIARATVCKHIEHAYAKLGQHDRLAAVMRARELGIIR